jgi:hypothetical protein
VSWKTSWWFACFSICIACARGGGGEFDKNDENDGGGGSMGPGGGTGAVGADGGGPVGPGGSGGTPVGPGGSGGGACVPMNEQCNGLDDDCDGQADDGNPGGGQSCSTGLLGVCASGQSQCSNAMITCMQTQFPSTDTCDGLDNDCNGTVDDGCGTCPNNMLMSVAPQNVNGNNAAAPSVYMGICGGSGPEDSYSFTAPASGLYTIDTIGSATDTVLHVHDMTCQGLELACDDDGGGGLTSLVQVNLTQGQQVVIFADSFSSGGSYVLNISGAAMCPSLSLGSTSPQTVNGDNSLGSSSYSGSCAGNGPENGYSFSAPATGTFTFDTIGSATDTVLHVHDGSCVGLELACDDDAGGNLTSLLSVGLTQGQAVVVFVDSFSSGGPYVLHVAGP